MKKIVAVLLVLFVPSVAKAGGYCFDEKIGYVIVVSDLIYFTTDKSCASWCLIAPGASDTEKTRDFSLLTSASLADRRMGFYWGDTGPACAAQTGSASPQFLFLQPAP